jgi:hypothetical protein
MKKLFIGLLMLAAGAGVYYFLQNKKTNTDKPVDKELLAGKWELDSTTSLKKTVLVFKTGIISPKDSTFQRYHYEFQQGGTLIQAVNDSVKAGTSHYEWGKKNELLIKALATDTTVEAYSVSKLSIDSLILRAKYSAVFVFTKLR